MKTQLWNDESNFDLTIGLDDADNLDALRNRLASSLKISEADLPEIEVKRRSIDARRGRVSLVVTLGLTDQEREQRIKRCFANIAQKKLTGEPVIIVGAGPAGLFCAYELARLGILSVVCDRGKMVQARRKDLKGLNQHGLVDDDSNYCFGEGGAGTYSDGKLYTRSHKRGSVREVLEILVAHGASSTILTAGRPHIGSNQLPKVITALRNSLEAVGVTFLFSARVVDLVREGQRVHGVILADGQTLTGRSVVLATGHSARDVLQLLHHHGAKLEAKPFAMGLRIEHSQALINRIQYGKLNGHEKLPPAYYRLAYTPSDKRGAFSFCMCPGGWIVPASTDKHGLVVNGMSLSRRDSPFANSGLVVAIGLEDMEKLGLKGPLAGIELQNKLEARTLFAGGGGLVAPASRVEDFVRGRLSRDLPTTSYLPGLKAADMTSLLDVTLLPLASRLKEALLYFNQVMPGYLTNEAIVVGVESRTSSPVRIVRDERSLSSNLLGLYPCGEGAGYAGGIMSAAMDGIKIARQIGGFL